MAENSAIAWTDHTFNPWWGCARVSPGCNNCYAEAFAKRVGQQVWGKTADRRRFGSTHWNQPLRWNEKATELGVCEFVFCASMADVFEDRDDHTADRNRLWTLIDLTPNLIWLLLTKRPENVLDMVPAIWDEGWPSNAWLGTTVEDQQRADERIPHLRNVPAPVRFLSCEPLLGPLELNLDGIGWVIVGGESGPGRRELDLVDFAEVFAQCSFAEVPLWVKQDSGPYPGRQGRIPDLMWRQQRPVVVAAHYPPETGTE